MALKEDSLTQWHSLRRVAPTALHTASWDYRMVDSQRASAEADAAPSSPCRWPTSTSLAPMLTKQLSKWSAWPKSNCKALSNQRKQFMGKGTVRTMAPGTTFELSDHDEPRAGVDGGQLWAGPSPTACATTSVPMRKQA